MKVGKRGEVAIPKQIRERFGIGPETDVEFRVARNTIVLEKKPKKLNFAKWKGHCRAGFAELGYASVDRFMEDLRGR